MAKLRIGPCILGGLLIVLAMSAHGQVSSLETVVNTPVPPGIAGSGPSSTAVPPTVANQTVNLRLNTDNSTGTNFVVASPNVTVTYQLLSQQYTMTAGETPTLTGVFFGGASSPDVSVDNDNLYAALNTIGSAADSHYTSSGGSATGTGISVAANAGMRISASTRALENALRSPASTNLWPMATLRLQFSQPVTNPILHLGGMGGAVGAFTYAVELDVSGASSLAELSENGFLGVSGFHIRSTDATPGSGCSPTGSGGACGSVRLNGTNLTFVDLLISVRGDGTRTTWNPPGFPDMHNVEAFYVGVSVNISDMVPAFGASTPTIVRPGQAFTGLTLTCTNNGPSGATNATCVPTVSAGTISALSCTPTPPANVNFGTGTTAIICTFTYTAPGTQGGADEPTTSVTFTGTTGATEDSNGGTTTGGNNQVTATATVIDAINDTDSKPATTVGATTNLSTNDQFPANSIFSTVTGGTCTAVSIAAATGVATYTVPASGTCTVNYQVCAPAPNATTCDLATLTVTAIPAFSISGTVFQDNATNLLADGAVGGANNPGIPSVTVRLFNSAGTQLSTTTTNASGAYSFTGLTGSSTYYVTVDAPMRTASGTTGILQEQTYASAGIGNAGTAGGSSGYGPLCVESSGSLSAPTYTNSDAGNPLTGTASSHSNGYCFGGRRGAVADAGGTTLASNEHLTRVVLGAGNVTAVDYGFSYDVVTNTNATGQGGIVQFVNNANLASGTDAMRVVPAVAPNASGGSGTWWETSLSALYGTSALPAFTSTILMEGTPYSNADGTTPTTTNPGDMVAASTAVGNQGDTLGSIPRPDFAINWVGATAAEYLIQMNTAGAANSVISNMALYGTGAATANSAMIGYNTGPITVTRNVLGAKPDGTAVAGSPRFVDGIRTDSTNGAAQTNTYNYITGMLTYGIDLRSANPSDQVNGYVTAHNYLIGNGTGITVVNANGYHAVINNYITGSTLNGVITSLSASFNNITENTATGNGGAGIRVDGPNNNILYNVTTSNSRGGIATQGATAQQVLISQNTFGNNTLNAIDLGNNGVTTATATGANCPSSGTTNASLPRGNITAASLSGTTVTMSGTYCNTGTYTIEVYKVGGAAVGDGTPQAGEGVQYLGSLTGFSGGTFTSQSFTLVSGATLAVGDQISFITIRTDGSSAAGGTAGHTSEFSPNFTLNPLADLSVTKTNTPGVNGDVDQANDTVTRGSTVNYTIVVSNAGPATANGAVLRDPAPSGMTCTVVSCAVTSGGAVCPSVTVAALQSPGGVIIATLPANSSLTFTLTCTVQ